MSFNSFLSARTVPHLTLISLCMTLVIGTLDKLTGAELSFSIFYIAPIALVSWYSGRKLGLFLCVLSAVIWFIVDLGSGQAYSHNAIPIWNASVRFGFFIAISLLLVKIKTTLNLEQEMANIDGLTALLNSRAFRASLTKLLDFCRRIKCPITLAYIDLDNFKKLNDTFGHAEGDRALSIVGSCLTKNLRNTDIVGRLGGDEFAVALPDTNMQQARTVLEKLHVQLMKETGLHNWPVGFSIGSISFAIAPASTDEAISLADNLMYRVKQAGKNKIFFEEKTDAE